MESWLARMDVWLGQMRPVGSTAEMLDVQVREQKVNLNTHCYLYVSVNNVSFAFPNFLISFFLHFDSRKMNL